MNKTIADLPPEMITEVVRRLDTPGNAERARAVAKTWLEANRPFDAARKAQRADAFKQALAAADRWVSERPDRHRTESNGVIVLEDEEGEKQTLYPPLSRNVVREVVYQNGENINEDMFEMRDVGPDGIRRLQRPQPYHNSLPEWQTPGASPVVVLQNAVDFAARTGKWFVHVLHRPQPGKPATGWDPVRDPGWGHGDILSVDVWSDSGEGQTLYPFAVNARPARQDNSQVGWWRLRDVTPDGRVSIRREWIPPGSIRYYDGPVSIEPPLAPAPAAPAALVPTARRFTGVSGTVYNLSMNGVLGHSAMQRQIDSAKAKGKRQANSANARGGAKRPKATT